MFWKTVIFNIICKIRHHLATLIVFVITWVRLGTWHMALTCGKETMLQYNCSHNSKIGAG